MATGAEDLQVRRLYPQQKLGNVPVPRLLLSLAPREANLLLAVAHVNSGWHHWEWIIS
jgi:hypothetical protein